MTSTADLYDEVGESYQSLALQLLDLVVEISGVSAVSAAACAR
jgi:hypothetical protein